MLVADAEPFAKSFAGQFLIPLLVILAAAAITGGIAVGVKIFHRFTEVTDIVMAIKAEVLPNGGSSLRDAVNRTEVMAQATDRKLRKHLRHAKAQTLRLDELYGTHHVE